MDLGANFIAKLEPFLLMSKSAKGAAAAKLIQDATSAPGVFVFAELLDQPNIQEVCCSDIIGKLVMAKQDAQSLPIASSTHHTSHCYNSSHTRRTRTISVRFTIL